MFLNDGKQLLKAHFRDIQENGSTVCRYFVLARRVKRYALFHGVACEIEVNEQGQYEVYEL